jgi:hypothetical protein
MKNSELWRPKIISAKESHVCRETNALCLCTLIVVCVSKHCLVVSMVGDPGVGF